MGAQSMAADTVTRSARKVSPSVRGVDPVRYCRARSARAAPIRVRTRSIRSSRIGSGSAVIRSSISSMARRCPCPAHQINAAHH
ncbi:hypothetical protein BG452_06960 [Streptomyces sp. CBMA123]|nr:hypothetical protein [Streptomyces sp. CBMA123]